MNEQANTHFLTDIEIKEFKCFKDFKAAGFKRVNLIGGKNNIGKTAFMEACYINLNSSSINRMTTAISNIKYWREFGNNPVIKKGDYIKLLDSTKKYLANSNILISGFFVSEFNATKEYHYTINNRQSNRIEEIINANNFSLIYDYDGRIGFIGNFGLSDNELIKSYQDVQKQDQEYTLNDYVQEFDNSIENFKVIGDKPQCKTNGEYRDITEFGDGLKHYISIICALYACENGYLLIDEIDNGIHYTQLDRLWEIILTLSKTTNCQVFASTHSKEMLESFARVAKRLNEQDISFTTLVKNKNQELKALTRDYEMILDGIEDGREVR